MRRSGCCVAPIINKWYGDYLLEICGRCGTLIKIVGAIIRYDTGNGD
jgi:hypothetical protein